MIKLVITGHGEFANGMLDVITLMMGDVIDLEKIVLDYSDLDEYSGRLEKLIQSSQEGTLIFTDVIGGTPFKTSALLCRKYDNVSVLTGVNVAMVLEAIIKRESAVSLKELTDYTAEMGRTSIQAFDKQVLEERSRGYQNP